MLSLSLAACATGDTGAQSRALNSQPIRLTDLPHVVQLEVVPLEAVAGLGRAEPSAPDIRPAPDPAEALPHAATAGLPVVTLPSLQASSEVAALARAAIRESDLASPGLDLIEQRILERVTTGRERWPQITPVADIDQDGDGQAGVRATLTLVDFGRSRARRAQADRAIELAWLDLWQERIDSVRDALGVLIDAGQTKALRDASALSLVDVTEMRQFAESRVDAGITDQSEQILYDVRLAELRNEINADTAALALALGQIRATTRRVFTDASVPELTAIETALLPPPAGSGPQELARARLQYQLAEHQLQLVSARRFPRLLLRGAVLTDGSDVSSTASLGPLRRPIFQGWQPDPQCGRRVRGSPQRGHGLHRWRGTCRSKRDALRWSAGVYRTRRLPWRYCWKKPVFR